MRLWGIGALKNYREPPSPAQYTLKERYQPGFGTAALSVMSRHMSSEAPRLIADHLTAHGRLGSALSDLLEKGPADFM